MNTSHDDSGEEIDPFDGPDTHSMDEVSQEEADRISLADHAHKSRIPVVGPCPEWNKPSTHKGVNVR